jgi:hypothetical protein
MPKLQIDKKVEIIKSPFPDSLDSTILGEP